MPSGRLGELLIQMGWRPEHLAERLNTLAVLHGLPERVHAKTPYKWLRGNRPRRPWSMLVAALLSEHFTQPITPTDLGWTTAEMDLNPANAGLLLPWTAAGGLQAVRALTHAEDMHRRTFLTLLGTTLTAPAHEWLIAHVTADSSRSTGAELPDEVIDQLDAITAGLRRMDDQLGGANLVVLVNAQLRAVLELLEHRRYSTAATAPPPAAASTAPPPNSCGSAASSPSTAATTRTPNVAGSPHCTPPTPPVTAVWAPTSWASCPARPRTSGEPVRRSPSPRPPEPATPRPPPASKPSSTCARPRPTPRTATSRTADERSTPRSTASPTPTPTKDRPTGPTGSTPPMPTARPAA